MTAYFVAAPISREERRAIWEALSEVYVDNEVHWSSVAQALAPYDMALLEAIFWEEVSPSCAMNMMAPAPPVWIAFNLDELEAEVRAWKAACGKSRKARIMHRLSVLWWRVWNRDVWRLVKKNIRQGR